MKLPQTQMDQFLLARARANQAMNHLGVATAEYEYVKQRLLSQERSDRDAQGDAVNAGLRALGFDPEDQRRHFHVDGDGNVMELVDGTYVEPRAA